MRHQALDRIRQVGHRRGGAAVVAAFLHRHAQSLDGVLQVAGGASGALAGIFLHGRGQPVFQIGVEAVLRLTRLQVEEAEDQRAGEAEQRRRERDAHAAERRGEAFLQRVEQRAGIAADLQPLDHLADRADGLDQAPEGAEQAEEHQEAGHVARDVAGLVQPRSDRIQQVPHGLLRDRHPPRAFTAQDRRHWRQQGRAPVECQARIRYPEIIDPGHFGIQPHHLPERQDDADHQHAADQRVEAGIGEERGHDLLVEHRHHQRAQHQEHHHPHQKDPGRGQLGQFDLHRGAGGWAWRHGEVIFLGGTDQMRNMAQPGDKKRSIPPD